MLKLNCFENFIKPKCWSTYNETTKIAGMEISAFPKSHKAFDPVSYGITRINKKLGIMTDVGYACKNIVDNVSDSDFLCLESNYDEKMLEEGRYPWPTKQWIKSDIGHLSNEQSASCVLEHAHKKLKNLMLWVLMKLILII